MNNRHLGGGRARGPSFTPSSRLETQPHSSRAKLLEKLHYIHANREKLVSHPGDWLWSSWSFYYRGEGLMEIDPWDSPSPTFPRKPTERRAAHPLQTQNRKG